MLTLVAPPRLSDPGPHSLLACVGTQKKSRQAQLRHNQRMSTPTRFELARAEPIGFQNQLLNHSDTVSPAYSTRRRAPHRKKSSTATRFELARAEPSRFRIYLLNHSDTVSWLLGDSASKA